MTEEEKAAEAKENEAYNADDAGNYSRAYRLWNEAAMLWEKAGNLWQRDFCFSMASQCGG